MRLAAITPPAGIDWGLLGTAFAKLNEEPVEYWYVVPFTTLLMVRAPLLLGETPEQFTGVATTLNVGLGKKVVGRNGKP